MGSDDRHLQLVTLSDGVLDVLDPNCAMLSVIHALSHTSVGSL